MLKGFLRLRRFEVQYLKLLKGIMQRFFS